MSSGKGEDWDEALRRIAEEAEARTGRLDLRGLMIEALPEEISALEHLEEVICSGGLFEDSPLANLEPLRGLPALHTLNCFNTQVASLEPLRGLSTLRDLNCSNTPIASLEPLRDLPALHTLHCSYTQIASLEPLRGLPALHTLACVGTKIATLEPLRGLPALQALHCFKTQIASLEPLRGLPALQELDCFGTNITSLEPLRSLPTLRRLHCSDTMLADLEPIAELEALAVLNILNLGLCYAPRTLWRSPALREVAARGTQFAEIEGTLFSGLGNDLPAIRAHLDDLEHAEGAVPLPDIKLFLLGNGRIGKTQIANRLRDAPFEENANSTHGILTHAAPIPDRPEGNFNIWDFGGQDVYHSSHALFLKSRAIFLLVWAPGHEEKPEHVHKGMRFRNRPLGWWLDYAIRFGERKAPVIVVQTRTDEIPDQGEHEAVRARREELGFHRSVSFSALKNNRRQLLAALADAAEELPRPLIGGVRLKVIRRLQGMLEANADLPDTDKVRLLPMAEVERICEEEGGVSSVVELLRFLHNSGELFWRQDLFGGAAILDQNWALEGVYTVFNRDACIRTLEARRGRFDRALLADLIWAEEGRTEAEQDLFLRFMQSCGICFELPGGEYVAPDLLPETWDAAERAERWGDAPPDAEIRIEFPAMPDALIRNLICAVGGRAGERADYWRSGFYGFSRNTNARLLVEAARRDDQGGTLTLAARGPGAAELAERMARTAEEEAARLALAFTRDAPLVREARREPVALEAEPIEAPRICISYAWNDDDGVEREAVVDMLCDEGRRRGREVLRDRDAMQRGDRISAFIRRIAEGDRIVVVLSDKYLRSRWCMWELYEIWRLCGQEGEAFRRKVVIWDLEDADHGSLEGRRALRGLWRDRWKALDAERLDDEDGLLSRDFYEEFTRARDIAQKLDEMLRLAGDILKAREAGDLVGDVFGAG